MSYFFLPCHQKDELNYLWFETHKTEMDSGYLLFRKKGIESALTEWNTLLIDCVCSWESAVGPKKKAGCFLTVHVPSRVPGTWSICGTEQI